MEGGHLLLAVMKMNCYRRLEHGHCTRATEIFAVAARLG
jgi:hypothetical protein